MKDSLPRKKRIVVKIGTSILSTAEGVFSKTTHSRLCKQVLQLMAKYEVVIVSSGAIALGMQATGRKKRPKEMRELQACAAIGQGKLMHAYETFFSRHGRHTAQILLTRDVVSDERRRFNTESTLKTLLAEKVLPIVNENDTVSTEEIAFGDNDILSVHVAGMIKADLLINLSNVNGFLKNGKRVPQITKRNFNATDMRAYIKEEITERTVGGMGAKLNAAKKSMDINIPFHIVDGKRPNVIVDAVSGRGEGTVFRP